MISRALDPGEAFFFMSDHVSCMNFVVFAERSSALPLERLRPVLDLIQQENALLQVRIDWTETHGLRFEPAPGLTIDLECHSPDATQWQDWIERELSRPFASGAAPLMRCLALQITDARHQTVTAAPANGDGIEVPTRSVLALTFHHAVADGRTGTALLRRLLSLLSPLGESTETSSPESKLAALPPMSDVHPACFRWAEQPEAAKQLRSTLINDYRRFGPLSPMPWLATEAADRLPKFIRLLLSAEHTQQLITQARAQSTTVHGLLCAAQLLAQHQLQGPSESSTFFLSCPIDMRAHLEPVQPVTPTAFMVSLISTTFQVSDATDIWALACDIMAQTRLQIARGEGHLLYHLFGLNGAPVLPNQMAVFRQKMLASLPNTMVSNVGTIDTVTDDPNVTAISFALCPMPYQTLFTAASSYQGQLILNVGFDAARLTQANAHKLVQAIAHYLTRAVP